MHQKLPAISGDNVTTAAKLDHLECITRTILGRGIRGVGQGLQQRFIVGRELVRPCWEGEQRAGIDGLIGDVLGNAAIVPIAQNLAVAKLQRHATIPAFEVAQCLQSNSEAVLAVLLARVMVLRQDLRALEADTCGIPS